MKPTKPQVLKYLSLKILESVSVFILMLSLFVICWPLGFRVWGVSDSEYGGSKFSVESGIATVLSLGAIMYLTMWRKEDGGPFWALYPLISAGIFLALYLAYRILSFTFYSFKQLYLKSEQEIVAANPTEMKDLLLRAAEKPNTLCMPSEEPRYQKGRSR